ncbi:glycosyltransferase [Clostridium carnis]
MRVLILASWYPDNNKPLNGIFFKEQAEALEKSGLDVIVLNINMSPITSIGKVKFKKRLEISEENGIKVYRYKTYNMFPKMYGLYIKYYSFLISKIMKIILDKEGKIDIVHIHSAFDAGIAYSQIKNRHPYVITEHSSRYHRNVINKIEDKFLYDTFTKAKKVIAVGKGLGEKISKYSGENKVDIIPNMVSVNQEIKEIDETKRRYRFFSLAFLNSYKGMDILIKAFWENIDIFKDVELYIGGEGPEKKPLQELINSLNLQGNITLLGEVKREKVPYYMQNCDSFVLASRVETFGIVFIEAMSYGKPVISTKTGGPDTFINDKCGISVEIDDICELSKAMRFMFENRHVYNTEYIINYCKNTFSEEVVAKKIEMIYNEVIGED